MNSRIGVLGFAAVLLLQGCRIVLTTGSGGSIVSQSGNHDCAENQICVVELAGPEAFEETFTAVPRSHYAFGGWHDTHHYLCEDEGNPCVVNVSQTMSRYNVTIHLKPDFYHQPELVDQGVLGTEEGRYLPGISNDNIGLLFAGDIDADGDDDVLIAAETNPAEEFAGVRKGVILTNDGDYAFRLAHGDGPSSVHPREVLVADFDGDGNNDLFIADHGHDTDPFPGWYNQLLMWTPDGYEDASDRLPDDPAGFTHNAAVGDVDGDGDIDILVANHGGQFMGGGPYFLLNDGAANFLASTSILPERVTEDPAYWTWATDLADFDGDGHLDLLMGGDTVTGESYVYWGSAAAKFNDDNVEVLEAPEFFHAIAGGYLPISTAVSDISGDGLLDVLLGSYAGPEYNRGLQILINRGNRRFNDETSRRLGDSAWSLNEPWHLEYRFLDFNRDGTIDIVPQQYAAEEPNVVAWLNDGTGHYVALKTTMFGDENAIQQFAEGLKVREGTEFKSLTFFGDGQTMAIDTGVVVTDALITLAD